jgi:hypothetical protein
MTAIPQPGVSRGVSERIAKPLGDVAARQWKLVAARASVHALLVALPVFLGAALLLGFLPTTPGWVRLPVAAITWATVLTSAVHFMRPALRRPSINDAAFTVERHVTGLQERLSSAVELAGERDAFVGSPALLCHLVRQAEGDAGSVRADAILPADAVKRRARWLVPLLVLWIAFAIATPRALFSGLYRVLLPWRDHLPAALATIAVTPGDVTLAEGDPLEIKATVNLGRGPETSAVHPLLLTRAADTERAVSQDLQALSPREFKASLSDVRQTFAYRVSTDRGESPWFTTTVLPRPAVVQLDLRYDYPGYCGSDPKVQPSTDGAIKALQGTEVTLTLYTSGAIDPGPGRSRIAVTEGKRQRDAELKPVEGKPNLYEAKLTVFNSGSYRVHLVNSHNLTNRDDQPRPIVAELDQPPMVAITAPASELSVRADDDVPVAFSASDDFGVARIQAMVQVDDKPAEAVDVNLSRAGADRRRLEGAWPLAVATHLARAGVTEAKTITYWLKATDNRDPDPQSTESAKQTLKIDNAQPLAYRTRVEQQQAKDLVQAIDRAIQRLQQADWPVNSLKDIDRGRAMNADEKKRAVEQRENLAKTSEELSDAAESNLRNAFSAVAAKAKEVAEAPVRDAAENVARSLLSADQPEPRAKAAADAARQMGSARRQLEELKGKVEARSKELAAGRELQKLAQKQSELARAQPKDGEKPKDADRKRQREKTQQRQRELAERLQRTVNDSEPLRDPKATEQAIRLRELLDRVEQIRKEQAPLNEQFARQEQTAKLLDQAEDLARRQQELNGAIERFAADRRPALQRADTRAPDPNHQAAILDRLRQNEPRQAHDLQRQSVEQLKQASKQLQQRGRSRDPRPNPVEQAILQERELAKQSAEQAAESAKQAAEQLRQAKESKNADQLAAAQKSVDQSAGSITEQARAAEAAVTDAAADDDATAKKDAEDAKRAAVAARDAADAARQAAQQGDAPQAAKKLDEAGKQLAKAQSEALDAARADLVADQQAASNTAAAQAKDLAARQAELADASKETAKALEQARQNQQSPQDVAARQDQLRDQAQQAAEQANQLEQLAKATHPSLARRAADAERLLQEAAAAEAQAAQSEQALEQARQQETQSLQQAAQADQQAATNGEQAAQSAAHAAEQQQQADAARRLSADLQSRKDEAAARSMEQQAVLANQQAEQHRKRTDELIAHSASAKRQAADSVKQADTAQESGAAARGKSAGQHARAEQALARAEDALRDVDRMTATAEGRRRDARTSAEPDPADAQRAAAAQPDRQANADTAQGKEAAAQPGRTPPSPPLTPDQAMRQAAQGAQEALQAQQQAMNINADADAIRQAAAALQQAAAAMAAASASGESSESSVAAADEQAETGGDVKAASETASARAASRTLDSRTGTGTGAGSHDGRPQSVQELGISAGDWARLAPLQRQDLLNAARQSGPPAYREMIKNYYVRIARLKANDQ